MRIARLIVIDETTPAPKGEASGNVQGQQATVIAIANLISTIKKIPIILAHRRFRS